MELSQLFFDFMRVSDWGAFWAVVSSSFFTILMVAAIESILSVDNGIANAAAARRLPPHLQAWAVFFGILAGVVLRIVALYFAATIAENPEIILAGGLYLLFISARHFWIGDKDKQVQAAERFLIAIIIISFNDLAFSVDNVVTAVGMSPIFAVIVIGVLVGIFTMLFVTQVLLVVMRRYPSLEHSAFLIIGFVGVMILLEHMHKLKGLGWFFHIDLGTGLKSLIVFLLLAGTIAFDEWERKRRAPVQTVLELKKPNGGGIDDNHL